MRSRNKSLKTVIVLLRDWVELVIVTACATDGEPHDRGADDVDSFGQYFIAAAGNFLIACVASHST